MPVATAADGGAIASRDYRLSRLPFSALPEVDIDHSGGHAHPVLYGCRRASAVTAPLEHSSSGECNYEVDVVAKFGGASITLRFQLTLPLRCL